MKDKNEKWYLFYGKQSEGAAWYDRDLKSKPSAEIETPWGKGKIEVEGDYQLRFDLCELVTIHRIQYEVRAYLHIRLSTEDYELRDISRRVARIKENGERVYCGDPTEKARKLIYDTIKPVLAAWADENGKLMLQGYTLKYENSITQARHKLDKLTEEIKQRYAYLDLVEAELKANGSISQEDKDRLGDLWGNSWRFY